MAENNKTRSDVAFDGDVIAVTGAASGIGAATAHFLATRGARVSLSDIDEEQGLRVTAAIAATGASATFSRCDIRSAAEVRHMLDRTVEVFGCLDAAVNNAGVAHANKRLADLGDDEWTHMLDVNLTGVFVCMREELSILQSAGHGAIVNIASVAGLGGAPGLAAYSASKHGVVGLTRTAALEYARRGIRVNAVCPSYTQTPMVEKIAEADPKLAETMQRASPMRRLGEAEEVASVVAWLCSPLSSFVNGQAVAVDGGITAW